MSFLVNRLKRARKMLDIALIFFKNKLTMITINNKIKLFFYIKANTNNEKIQCSISHKCIFFIMRNFEC